MATPAETLLERLELTGPALDWARAETRGVGTAWATCPRGEWLLAIAAHLELDRRKLVRAASDCLLVALPHAAAEPAAREAFEVARRWLERRATSAECWAAGVAARQSADAVTPSDPRAGAALRAASAVAFACDDRAEPAFWAQRAYVVEAVEHVVASSSHQTAVTRRTAELVRQHIPYELVARPIALVSRTSRSSGFHAADLLGDAADAPRSAYERT